MFYATIICKSFYRNGVQTRVELVPVHSINRSATAVSKYMYTYIYINIYICISYIHCGSASTEGADTQTAPNGLHFLSYFFQDSEGKYNWRKKSETWDENFVQQKIIRIFFRIRFRTLRIFETKKNILPTFILKGLSTYR